MVTRQPGHSLGSVVAVFHTLASYYGLMTRGSDQLAIGPQVPFLMCRF